MSATGSPCSTPDPYDHAEALDVFDDRDFYPPTPPPKTTTYTTHAGETLTLHLVGHSPLEAHHLWNGARVVADHLQSHPDLAQGRTVLELGAGAGLPSLVAASLGAQTVVMTDFPDPELLRTMQQNVDECAMWLAQAERVPDAHRNIAVRGFVWGADAQPLLGCLDAPARGFDVLILADLLFRHSEHASLLDTVAATLGRRRDAVALVVFASYRPWLAHKDLAFFDVARMRGFVVEQLFERKMERPLFEHDPGDEEVRKTVLGFRLRWPEGECVG